MAWYQKKWMIVGWHVLAWIVVLSLPWLLRLTYDTNISKNPAENRFFLLNMLTGFLWIALFYLNAFYLFPKFIHHKKYTLYALILLVLFVVAISVHGYLFHLLIVGKKFYFLLSAGFNLPAFLLSIATSTIYRSVNDKMKADAIAQEKQQENLKTELSFLRSQISPHFIFNILNNMVALVRMKSEQLEPTIIKLSSLLQYMLYETNEDKVLLRTEVEYLHAYIDLQQQRFGSKVKINIDIEISDDFHEIEPMLLIPFVENAFKHGVGMIEHPEINITMKCDNGKLQFSVRNKYNNDRLEIKDKTSGIGLTNVQRRLNLLYGEHHSLLINTNQNWRDEKKEDWFEATLELNFNHD
jgi:two-component system LytT family sensor kinase